MLGCAFDKESSFSFPLVSFAVFDEEEESEEHVLLVLLLLLVAVFVVVVVVVLLLLLLPLVVLNLVSVVVVVIIPSPFGGKQEQHKLVVFLLDDLPPANASLFAQELKAFSLKHHQAFVRALATTTSEHATRQAQDAKSRYERQWDEHLRLRNGEMHDSDRICVYINERVDQDEYLKAMAKCESGMQVWEILRSSFWLVPRTRNSWSRNNYGLRPLPLAPDHGSLL